MNSTKCWRSGRKLSITSPESPLKTAGWFFVIRKEEGLTYSLDRYPERRSGKRSRLHLDLYTTDSEAEVERLVKLGARRYPWRYAPGSDFVVLEDPDGNLFCVVHVPGD
jgi:Glyoxalase-like domain